MAGSEKKTFLVEVTQLVQVELDPTKFTDTFMAEFRQNFFDCEDLEDHAKHIAQLQARGVIEATRTVGEFIEGYGPSLEMGIVAEVIATDIERVGRAG